MAADLVTPEAINFMARDGRGLICLSLTEERVAAAGPAHDGAPTTGPPPHGLHGQHRRAPRDRPPASRRASGPTPSGPPSRATPGPTTWSRPGHIFPLRARRGGVLVRSGQTEGSVDLARLAGREPAGVICEIMRDDGEMARMPDLLEPSPQARPAASSRSPTSSSTGWRRRCWCAAVAEATLRPRAGRRHERVPRLRLRHRRRGHRVPGAGAGRASARRARRWCASRRPACCATCSAASPVRGRCIPPTVPLRMIEEAGAGILLYVFPRGRASLVSDFKPFVASSGSAEPGSVHADANSPLRDFGLGRAGAGAPRGADGPPSDQPPASHRRARRLRHRGHRVRADPAAPEGGGAARRRRRQEVGVSQTESKASSYGKASSGVSHEGAQKTNGRRFALVAARFNDAIVGKLLDGARQALREAGAADGDVELFRCPGAMELPGLARRVADGGRFDGIVCLGAVIRGGTPHFDLVAGESARAIGALAAEGRLAGRLRRARLRHDGAGARALGHRQEGQPGLRRRHGRGGDGRSLRPPRGGCAARLSSGHPATGASAAPPSSPQMKART